MGKGKQSLFIIVALLFFGSYFVSQLVVNKLGPSDQNINKLFVEYFYQNTPKSWGADKMIQQIKISKIKLGPSLVNEEGRLPLPYLTYENCWPVSMHVNVITENLSVFDDTVNHFDVCITRDGRQIAETLGSFISMRKK